MPINNNWIPTIVRFPKDKELVLALDWTYDDILVTLVQFNEKNIAGNPEWKVISGGEIQKPALWQPIELPQLVKKDFPNLFGG